MVKFKITPERFAEAASIIDYLNASAKNYEAIIRLAPRFVLGDDGEYIVKVVLDEDGDITGFDNFAEALQKMAGVTPKRLEKLIDEFAAAAKNIVNPTNGAG